jgi:hypothetical protein
MKELTGGKRLFSEDLEVRDELKID